MKRILLFITLAACSLTANAQLLWKISGNGLERPSYVFGTHHMASRAICDSISGFKDAFASVEQVIGEVETELMNDPATMTQMMPYMMMPEGVKLTSLLTPKEVILINGFIKPRLGFTLKDLNAMKPAFLSNMITLTLSAEHFPEFENQEGIDSYLQSRAKKYGKRVGGLETVEFQMDMLFNEDLETQADDLVDLVKNGDKAMKATGKLAQIYMTQDMKKINRFMHKSSDKEGIKKLLDDRNMNWIVQMKVIMPETPTMFVVGAGHLPGKNGVLKLLENEGYTVEPIY